MRKHFFKMTKKLDARMQKMEYFHRIERDQITYENLKKDFKELCTFLRENKAGDYTANEACVKEVRKFCNKYTKYVSMLSKRGTNYWFIATKAHAIEKSYDKDYHISTLGSWMDVPGGFDFESIIKNSKFNEIVVKHLDRVKNEINLLVDKMENENPIFSFTRKSIEISNYTKNVDVDLKIKIKGVDNVVWFTKSFGPTELDRLKYSLDWHITRKIEDAIDKEKVHLLKSIKEGKEKLKRDNKALKVLVNL